MAGLLPPGIGNPQQALQATAFIRSEPWYQQWIRSLGKVPDANGNVKLTDDQASQLREMAITHGIGLNDKFDGIDENGQIVEEHHKLRNTLIGAAIGGAALTGFGAAGIGPLSGAFGAGSSAAAGTGSAAASGAGAAGTVGTGAGVAGTAAKAASGAGWFSPANIIPSAIQGIASIFGANQQANASSEAAQLQYKSTEEALADARAQREYEKTQYANYLGRLQPYLGLGTNASSTLQNLLARSPYTKLANNGPLPQYSTAQRSMPVTPMPAVQQGQAGPTANTPPPDNQMPTFLGSTGTIKLQAPDGSVKDVPMAQADHFKKLGAVQV